MLGALALLFQALGVKGDTGSADSFPKGSADGVQLAIADQRRLYSDAGGSSA